MTALIIITFWLIIYLSLPTYKPYYKFEPYVPHGASYGMGFGLPLLNFHPYYPPAATPTQISSITQLLTPEDKLSFIPKWINSQSQFPFDSWLSTHIKYLDYFTADDLLKELNQKSLERCDTRFLKLHYNYN